MAEQPRFIPKHGPDRPTQDFYLGKLEQIAGKEQGSFTTSQKREKRIKQAERAYKLFKQHQEEAGRRYMARWNNYRDMHTAWEHGGSQGPEPQEPEVPQPNHWEQRFVNYFVPGYEKHPEGKTPEQLVNEVRPFLEKSAQFAQAAGGLEDVMARFGNEPGNHTPSILPAAKQWYEAHRAGQPTQHLMLGAASQTSAENLSNIVHLVDSQAQLTVMDIEPLSPLPQGETVPEERGFTFIRGNALQLLHTTILFQNGQYEKNSFDAIHEHALLFGGGNQLKSQPTQYSEERQGIVTVPVVESQKEKIIPSMLYQIHQVLRPGGAAFFTERINPNDAQHVEDFIHMLTSAGFKRENIHITAPSKRFATRRDVDAFFASGATDVDAFATERTQESGKPTVEDDVDYEPTIFVMAVKSEKQGRFGDFLKRRG